MPPPRAAGIGRRAPGHGAGVARPFHGGLRLSGVRVLVVDDNADQLTILRGVLEHSGARVTVARSAQEAFDSFQADPPDVVLTDLAMPQATGYNLVSRIRRSRHGAVPAVAITAHHEDEHREKALAFGFDEWLAKPAVDVVVSVVARLAGRA